MARGSHCGVFSPNRLRPGCRGIGVTANGQNQTASVGGRVPTVGLTSGVLMGAPFILNCTLVYSTAPFGRSC